MTPKALSRQIHCEKCSYRGNEWAGTGIVGCCKSDCDCYTEIVDMDKIEKQKQFIIKITR